MLRTAWLVGLALLLGCATNDKWIPHCESDEGGTTPSVACLEQPQSREVTSYLSKVINPAAGPFAVLVEFDEASRVSSLCTIRNQTPRQWDAQKRLNDRFDEIMQAPAGPECLATTTILLNRAGQELGKLKQILHNCRGDESGGTNRLDRICLERRQVQRGELWFFNTRQDYPYVYKPVREDATNRLSALDRCTDVPETKPVALPEIKVGFTFSLERLNECLAPLGWERTI